MLVDSGSLRKVFCCTERERDREREMQAELCYAGVIRVLGHVCGGFLCLVFVTGVSLSLLTRTQLTRRRYVTRLVLARVTCGML